MLFALYNFEGLSFQLMNYIDFHQNNFSIRICMRENCEPSKSQKLVFLSDQEISWK